MSYLLILNYMLGFLGKEKEKYSLCFTGETRYTNINIKVGLSTQVKTVSITGTQNRD